MDSQRNLSSIDDLQKPFNCHIVRGATFLIGPILVARPRGMLRWGGCFLCNRHYCWNSYVRRSSFPTRMYAACVADYSTNAGVETTRADQIAFARAQIKVGADTAVGNVMSPGTSGMNIMHTTVADSSAGALVNAKYSLTFALNTTSFAWSTFYKSSTTMTVKQCLLDCYTWTRGFIAGLSCVKQGDLFAGTFVR